MTTTFKEERRSSKPRFFLTLWMHQLLGTIGVLILAGTLTTIAFEFPNPWGHTVTANDVTRVLRGTPYFPVQITVAFLFGWLMSELFGHKSMLWIWVLPYVWLVYNFVRLPTVQGMPFSARLDHFFGWGCRPENHCIDQTSVTVAFYVAVAYSIGALMARKLPMRSSAMRRNVSGIVLLIGVLILADEVKGLVFHFKHYLALVPQGWEWLLLPAGVLDAGIGVGFILLALKMRRVPMELEESHLVGN